MIVQQLQAWALPAGVLAASLVLGYVVKRCFIARLARLSPRTRTVLDDLLVRAAGPFVPLWLFLGGLVLAAALSPLSPHLVDKGQRGIAALFVLTLSLAAGRFAGDLVESSSERTAGTFISTSLTRNVVKVAVFLVGTLLVLDNLGLKITPLLTALGVGSLAVALALQPTLSNLFAGLHITLTKPVSVGDFVELEGGIQGFVADIGWRSTQIRELTNNIVIVPNSRLADMVMKNYARPALEQSIVIPVAIGIHHDLQRVESMTCEVARQVLAGTEGAVPSFEPFLRYQTFGNASITFAVVLKVKHFADRALVTHEFLMRLKERFENESIEVFLPQRAPPVAL